MPPHRPFDHQIPLVPAAIPVHKKPYRYAPTQKDELERQVKDMLARGVIQPSHSPYASPVILVKKKDGGWRMCVDYRYLNALTVKNKYPLPIVEELLDELAGAKYFTKLDLRSGYHQIRLVEGEEFKTAFKTHHGHWEFKVMPFGLTNAPATFQSAMNLLFAHMLRKGVLIFMDDILIYSPTLEEHEKLLTQVFQILMENQLYIKQSKCFFAQTKLEYLGHVISAEGVATDPSKIHAIQAWPPPTTAKQLRAFLGLAGYYRKFIANYGTISRPLTELLKKNVQFVWSSVASSAFVALQNALIQAPVLALPNFKLPFDLHTDASGLGIGAVLSQQGHPVAYLSKALSLRAQALSTYEKECLALIMAVEKWKPYLQHKEFTVYTDHKSLTHLESQQLTNNIQHKAFCKLLGLQYKVKYKQGTANSVADALSRCMPTTELSAISVSKPRWLEIIVDSYLKDPEAKKLLTQLSVASPDDQGYSLHDGVIKFNNRIWLGNHAEAKQAILLALHSSGVGGHSGIAATYHKIRSLFAWPHMKQDIKNYIEQCSICQQAKSEHVGTPGLLQPLPIPDKPWEIISLDFVEGLPKSNRYDTILVIVDKFTKYGHFIPLAHPYTALSVAQLFVDHIYKLHGLPKIIISDRDKVFTSALWQQLFKLTDITLNMSSSYHPQTDGQTERLNQCMETYLRCMTHACPSKWSKWLALAEYWYNTTLHSALGRSPFEVLYGYKPKHFGLQVGVSTSLPDLETWLKEKDDMNKLIQQHLLRAQQRMKSQADKHRVEHTFEVGDKVYLKLQPYVQTSIARRSNQKLSFKFFGPYEIIQKVGAVAYKLQLPLDSHIHPVVHVSMLKKAIPAATVAQPDLPSQCSVLDTAPVPLQVMDTKHLLAGNSPVELVQIQWSGLPSSWLTWENKIRLMADYPNTPAWGQAGSQGGEYVTTVDMLEPQVKGADKRTRDDKEDNDKVDPGNRHVIT